MADPASLHGHSDSGYATCDECGNPLNESEHFRGSLCDSCAEFALEAAHEWTDQDYDRADGHA